MNARHLRQTHHCYTEGFGYAVGRNRGCAWLLQAIDKGSYLRCVRRKNVCQNCNPCLQSTIHAHFIAHQTFIRDPPERTSRLNIRLRNNLEERAVSEF